MASDREIGTPLDRQATPMLGLASTEALLAEVAYRMRATQNSIKGRDLGDLCREAIDNLDGHILRYRPVQEPLTWREAAAVSAVQASLTASSEGAG